MLRYEMYKKSCKSFYNESYYWSALPNKFYTDDGEGNWIESCDNSHGGLDVSWVWQYPRYENFIQDKFIEFIGDIINITINDNWGSEQIEYIKKLLK